MEECLNTRKHSSCHPTNEMKAHFRAFGVEERWLHGVEDANVPVIVSECHDRERDNECHANVKDSVVNKADDILLQIFSIIIQTSTSVFPVNLK